MARVAHFGQSRGGGSRDVEMEDVTEPSDNEQGDEMECGAEQLRSDWLKVQIIELQRMKKHYDALLTKRQDGGNSAIPRPPKKRATESKTSHEIPMDIADDVMMNYTHDSELKRKYLRNRRSRLARAENRALLAKQKMTESNNALLQSTTTTSTMSNLTAAAAAAKKKMMNRSKSINNNNNNNNNGNGNHNKKERRKNGAFAAAASGSSSPFGDRMGSHLFMGARTPNKGNNKPDFDINDMVLPFSWQNKTKIEELKVKEICTPRCRKLSSELVDSPMRTDSISSKASTPEDTTSLQQKEIMQMQQQNKKNEEEEEEIQFNHANNTNNNKMDMEEEVVEEEVEEKNGNSSDEDTSDEAYEQRHRLLENLEIKRRMPLVLERKKKADKQQQQQQQDDLTTLQLDSTPKESSPLPNSQPSLLQF